MASTVLIFFAIALFVQATYCQCIGNPLNTGLNFNGLPYGANFANGLPGSGLAGAGLAGPGYGATGGGFPVTSTSPMVPTGVSVLAENLAIEGPLSVGGQLPFLGTVGLEGTLPAIGSGVVSYGCGSAGNVGITSEGLAGPGNQGPYGMAGQAYGPGLAGSAYGPGLANPGYGPGLAGSGYGAGLGGPGLAGPGFAAAGLAGTAYGSGLGPAYAGLAGPAFGPGLAGPGLAGPGLGNGLVGPGFGAGFGGISSGLGLK